MKKFEVVYSLYHERGQAPFWVGRFRCQTLRFAKDWFKSCGRGSLGTMSIYALEGSFCRHYKLENGVVRVYHGSAKDVKF